MLRLYDLAGAEDERRFSPYCWRIRMALAHKGLPVETIAWRFTDKSAIAPSGQGRVPVLVDGKQWLHESWDIACYLEDRHPEGPSLFGGPQGRALSRLYSHLGDWINGQLVRLLVCDIHDHLDERDRAYFRESREQRFGAPLEVIAADRESRLPAIRDSLAPLRATLQHQPFFGGTEPLYADYAIFGAFQWARAISPLAILASDDPLAHWRERLLDAHGGLARSSPGYDR
jgi:glutathione S-transferase